ncbi:MAG: Nif3-like dinuclear metal center hexameric protein [Clostridia bacterium]|nr:Nif3-like dinuclear metal center hexameric protein [Clostridia bacterium]
MLTNTLYDFLESKLPKTLSCPWDHDGLGVLPSDTHITNKVLLAVDITMNVLKYAKENGFDTVISHHAINFSKIPELTGRDVIGKRALYAYTNGIAVMGFHTRLDASEYGINMLTAQRLGLTDITVFEHGGERLGYTGRFDGGIEFDKVLSDYKALTGSPCPAYVKAKERIETALVVCGAYSEGAYVSSGIGVDLFISGEIKHHALLDAYDMGVSCIGADHFHSEKISIECLKQILSEQPIQIEIYPFESEINYAV